MEGGGSLRRDGDVAGRRLRPPERQCSEGGEKKRADQTRGRGAGADVALRRGVTHSVGVLRCRRPALGGASPPARSWEHKSRSSALPAS